MKKIALASLVALALSACTLPRGGTGLSSNEPLEVWDNFENVSALDIAKQELGKDQALVVLYRKDDITGRALNVYINRDYQASLLPNAYSAVAICADKHLFSSSFTTNKKFGNRGKGTHYTLPAGEVIYIRMLQDKNGETHFQKVEKSVAEKELADLPRESQTLPRVFQNKACNPNVVIANLSMEGNSLFLFDRYGYDDILPEAREQLDKFMEYLKTLNVSSIVVSGHTDPSGSDKYNQLLSERRANSVKKQLQKVGVNTEIQAVGLGEKEPIITSCGTLKGEARNQCNQPNRRVEITVYGKNQE